MPEKYYDDSMRMDDIESKLESNRIFEQIKKECEGCEAWGGDDCTRNPYTQGCLKDSNEQVEEKYEMVNHPKHYNPGVYEAINVIEAYDLNFSLGNAIKYILRTAKGKPDASLDEKMKAAEDLRKAAWYCSREANRIIQEKTIKNS